MPLRLKHLDLHGYKTFASQSEFVFGAGISAIVGPNGSGKCVSGDTLVTLADGRDLPIRELVASALNESAAAETLPDGTLARENPGGIQVLSLNPDSLRLEARPVAAFVKRRAPADLLRVRTRAGREVTATPYHPFFTLENGQLKALKAEELQPGVRVALPRCLPTARRPIQIPAVETVAKFKDDDGIFVPNIEALRTWADEARAHFRTWADWRRAADVPQTQLGGLLNGQAVNAAVLTWLAAAAELPPPLTGALKSANTGRQLCFPSALTPDLARFLGLLIAEGRSTDSNQVWFVNADPAVNDEFERLARTLFAVDVSRKHYKTCAEDVLIYSHTLQLALERWFNFRVGSTSAEKELPPQLLEADEATQWAFLSGLFEGDAYVCARPKTDNRRAQAYIEYVSASPRLAGQVIALLLRLGLFAQLRVHWKAASNTHEKQRRPYYSVFLYGTEQLRQAAQHLTFLGEKARSLEALRCLPPAANPNLDLVPGVTPLVGEAVRRANVRVKPNRREHPRLAAYVENRCEASRGGLLETVEQIMRLGSTPGAARGCLNQLARLAASDIYWDEITSLESVPPSEEWVYDLCIADTHNFVAGQVIVHNSNIVDSIRWVLGEQSFNLLRGKKTEDMIFAGSELRARAGMAQATLTFDNSDGWLPIDFSEVSISRRAYRDGGNEYLLNGQRVRLRDISEMLSKCGLAERNYTIIGQGLIDTALSLKAEERRALFEEAAGIGVYRNKREEALRKLEATQRNLERALDILAEIKPRLRSLERQAQRARDYNQVKDDLHALLKTWYGYHWHHAVEALDQTRLAAELTAADLAHEQSQQTDFNRDVAQLRAEIATLRGKINTWRADAARLHGESEGLARAAAVAGERLRSLAAQREALLADLPPLEAQQAEQAGRADEARAEAGRLAAEAAEMRAQVQAIQVSLAEREGKRASLLKLEADARARLGHIETRDIELTMRQKQLAAHSRELEVQTEELEAALRQLQTAEEAARELVYTANARLNTLQAERAGAESRLVAQNAAIRTADAEMAAAAQRATDARTHLERLQARQEVLAQARAELAGFASGAKTLLAQQFPTRGALAELLSVPTELETAVSAALGFYVEALVVADWTETDAAVQALGEGHGRAALLPLQRLTAPEPLAAPDDPECLGCAARLVQVEESLRPAVNLLLGHVMVVRDAAAARRLAAQAPARPGSASPDYVTLSGEVYLASGPVLAGREAAPSMLQQARERRDLSAEIEAQHAICTQLDEQREAAARAAAETRSDLAQVQSALSEAQTRERHALVSRDSTALEAERVSHNVQFLAEQIARLKAETGQAAAEAAPLTEALTQLAEERRAAEAQLESASASAASFSAEEAAEKLSQAQTAAAVAARAAEDAQTRAAELDRATRAAGERLAEQRAKIEKLRMEAAAVEAATQVRQEREADLAGQISDVDEMLRPAERQIAALEAAQTSLESGDTDARTAVQAAERCNAEAQLTLTRKTEELDNLRRRIEEDFGLVEFDYGESLTGPTPLPMYPIVEKLEPVAELPEGLEDQLNRKRGQLRRMGLINPEAEKEFVEVRERHEFLTTQTADLAAAQAQLKEVIAELDVLMERDFRKTFDAVANEFKDTFARMFGGGTAKLVLTDPEHLSTSGVDIQARLPGRRTQGLAVLSGGERSLTACALIFALLRVAPTPFCVLDEVDAMLDEANVGRYRDMLVELAHETQFIVVTHNRNTVQAADTVYGITMGNDSASQVIGLKLDGEKISGAAERRAGLPSAVRAAVSED
jgi:chromosome segregation protein